MEHNIGKKKKPLMHVLTAHCMPVVSPHRSLFVDLHPSTRLVVVDFLC